MLHPKLFMSFKLKAVFIVTSLLRTHSTEPFQFLGPMSVIYLYICSSFIVNMTETIRSFRLTNTNNYAFFTLNPVSFSHHTKLLFTTVHCFIDSKISTKIFKFFPFENIHCNNAFMFFEAETSTNLRVLNLMTM